VSVSSINSVQLSFSVSHSFTAADSDSADSADSVLLLHGDRHTRLSHARYQDVDRQSTTNNGK